MVVIIYVTVFLTLGKGVIFQIAVITTLVMVIIIKDIRTI